MKSLTLLDLHRYIDEYQSSNGRAPPRIELSSEECAQIMRLLTTEEVCRIAEGLPFRFRGIPVVVVKE